MITLQIQIPLSDLVLDCRLQMRETMNFAAIDDYADNIDSLPPGKVVMSEDGLFWLYDGWHSHHAHQKAKRTTMNCTVVKGTFLDALQFAASSNHGHGIQRTTADKRRAVLALLAEKSWQKRSDRMIAETCHVSHTLVSSIRKNENAQTDTEKEDDSTGNNANGNSHQKNGSAKPKNRTGRDGRERPTKPAKPPKVPAIICIHCKNRLDKGAPLIVDCPDCKLARELDKAKDRLCERCTQIGYQDGCTACQYLRENPKASKPPKEPDKLTDDAGTVVPQRLVKVFKTVELYRKAERELNALGKTFKQIEESPAKEAKPLDKNAHFEKFFAVFKNARWRVKNMRPAVVCKTCGGDGCEKCSNLGWLTSEMAKVKGMI